MVRPLLAATSSIGIPAVDGLCFATIASGAKENQFLLPPTGW